MKVEVVACLFVNFVTLLATKAKWAIVSLESMLLIDLPLLDGIESLYLFSFFLRSS